MFQFCFAFIFILVIGEGFGRRSDIECAKWIGHHETKTQPNYIDSPIFIVRKIFANNSVSHMCSAILISSQYVLTSGSCGDGLVVNLSEVFLNKEDSIIITDVFPYDLDRVYPYYLKKNKQPIEPVKHSIALLKLKYEIDVTKIRPACLWTSEYLPLVAQLVYNHDENPRYLSKDPEKRISAFQFEPVQALPMDGCKRYFDILNIICLDVVNRREQFYPNMGSSIIYNTPDALYITGLYTRRYVKSRNNGSLITGTKLQYKHLDWIESVVWSERRTSYLPCGEARANINSKLSGFNTVTFPWHVAVYSRDRGNAIRFFCSGTIINKSTILTASACVRHIRKPFEHDFDIAHNLTVIVRKYNSDFLTLESNELQLKSFSTNKNIATLELVTKIKNSDYFQPVCITNNTDYYKTDFGVLSGSVGLQNVNRKQGSLQIRSIQKCQCIIDLPDLITGDNFFCVNSGTAILGDSLVMEKNGRWFIRGVTIKVYSAAVLNHRCGYDVDFVVFQEIELVYAWINTNLWFQSRGRLDYDEMDK